MLLRRFYVTENAHGAFLQLNERLRLTSAQLLVRRTKTVSLVLRPALFDTRRRSYSQARHSACQESKSKSVASGAAFHACDHSGLTRVFADDLPCNM
jgi:hypothetical protein